MSDTSAIRYVPLWELFPCTHRVTLYRWLRDGKIPPPDLVIGNRKFWIERPLTAPAGNDQTDTPTK
ncbi:hypothetical protein ACVWXQ_006681 [Bradyrhizobium sp. S3.14.4]